MMPDKRQMGVVDRRTIPPPPYNDAIHLVSSSTCCAIAMGSFGTVARSFIYLFPPLFRWLIVRFHCSPICQCHWWAEGT